MDIKEMTTPSYQITVEGVSLRSHKTIDLRDNVLSHRWVLPNGNDIKMVNADYHWLYKDSTLLKITEATGEYVLKPQVQQLNDIWLISLKQKLIRL